MDENPGQEDEDGNGIGDACERADRLEKWLRNLMLRASPGTLPPHCPGGCGPVPEWLRDYPYEEEILIAPRANHVIPLSFDYQEQRINFDGTARVYALGRTSERTLHLQAQVVGYGQGAGAEAGIYAVLLDADGNELWRVEKEQDRAQLSIDLEPGKTNLLIINAPRGVEVNVDIDLP
jgi:hypothetical protein